MDSTVRVIFLGDASSAIRSVSTLEGRMGSLGGTAARTGKILAGAIGISLVGGLAKATSLAIGFDRSMRNVNSIAKVNEASFQRLEKRVLALSKATGQGPKVLADGLYDIVSSGFKANDAIKILAVSAKAATAGMTDTATASKAVVAVLNAYHLGADKARGVSDVLFQTVNKGVLTFSELSQQIGDVLPYAAKLNVPLTDIGGALATITLHGVNAAEGATQLKQVMASIIAPSKGLNKQLHDMGYESGQSALKALGFQGVIRKLSDASKGNAATLHDWFPNIRALSGFFGISGKNAKQLADNIRSMSNASKGAGATNKAFAEQGKSIAVQYDKASEALAAAGVKLGTTFFPVLATGITKLADFAGWLDKLAGQHTIQAKLEFAGQGLLGAGKSIKDLLLGGQKQIAVPAVLAFNMRQGGTGTVPTQGLVQEIAKGIQRGIESTDWSRIGQSLSDKIGDATRDQAKGHNWNDVARSLTTGLVGTLSSLNEEFARDVARQIGRLITGAIDGAIHLSLGDIKTGFKTLGMAMIAAFRVYVGGAFGFATGLIEGLTGKRFSGSVRQLVESIPGVIKNAAEGVPAAALAIADAIVRGIKSAPGKLVGLAGDLAGAIQPALGQAAKDAYGWALHIGEQIASGVLHGLAGLPGKIAGAIGIGGSGKGKTLPGGQQNPRFTKSAAGNFIDRPMLSVVGEDAPRWPEWIIPSNPQHRGRALGLLSQAQSALGLPGFAKGGGPSGHHYTGHQTRRRGAVNLKGVLGQAKSSLASLTAVQQSISDASRRYDQTDRAFGATDEQFTIDVPDDPNDPSGSTHPAINQPGINARVAELNELVTQKNGILALLEQERQAIDDAITKVQKAIDDLLDAIKQLEAKAKAEAAAARQERAAAASDRASVNRKGGLAQQLADEQAKKKPSASVIAGLQKQIKAAGHSADAHDAAAGRHDTNQGRLHDQASAKAGQVSDLRGTLADLGTQRHDQPFDVQDQQIDLQYLQAEIARDTATTVSPFTPGATVTDAGGASTSASSLVNDLMAQIQRMTEALGLQGAQQGVLGAFPSFASGAIHIPNDMVAQLHAGESVRTADQTASDSRNGATGPNVVELHLSGALETLHDMIDVRVVSQVPTIVQKIGRSADTLRRSNMLT